MAKRSPILGYNHNVRYRGIVLHVQTEDSGIMNPHVFSHLFHGGVILSTRKLVYDPGATEDVVKALMQAQHKAVMKDLRRGVFDDKIDQYLGGTPGLLPRAATETEAGPISEPVVEPVAAAPAGPPAVEPVVEPVVEPAVEPPAVEPPAVIGAPEVARPATPWASLAAFDAEPAMELSPYEASPYEASPYDDAAEAPLTDPEAPPLGEVTDPSPQGPITGEQSGPAIEVIEALEPPLELDLAPSRPPSIDFGAPPTAADLGLGDDSPFEIITTRTPPPVTQDIETERVPVMFPELVEPPPEPPPPTVRTSVRITVPPISAEPPPPSQPQVARVPTPRLEPGRSGPVPAVRVSFVSARGPAPAEPPRVEPPTDPSTYDVVSLDSIETPPAGVSTFEDLLPPPLPPPPMPTRGPGATPPFGIPTSRSGRPAIETVPRLAGVPAPTPPPIPATTTPHGMVAVPPPPPPPPGVHGSHPAMARPGTVDPMQRVPLHTPTTPAIDDDDLQAAGLVESGDVAEIHAPPLPSATNPPGVAPERPGEYRVTRREAPPAARPTSSTRNSVMPPRPPPSTTRPQTSGGAGATYRPTPPASPVLTRPTPKAPPPPPKPTAPVPAASPRPDTSRSEPMAAQPRPPTGQRPAPRPRPTTGAGVVVSRPAVIVGAPQRPPTSPAAPVRTRRARDTGSDGLITERSLDEVILAYLSEDGSEE